MQRIRTGDLVEVIRGADRGIRGEVKAVYPRRDRIMIHGVNVRKKHQKRVPGVQTQTGIIEFEAPIHASNVALVCQACDRPVRVGVRVESDGRKTRVCRSCDGVID